MKKNIRKLLSLILALCLVLTLAACGSSSSDDDEDEKDPHAGTYRFVKMYNDYITITAEDLADVAEPGSDDEIYVKWGKDGSVTLHTADGRNVKLDVTSTTLSNEDEEMEYNYEFDGDTLILEDEGVKMEFQKD